MRTLKIFYLFLMAFTMNVALTSCGDDDDSEYVNTFQDYFIEVQCAGGGLNAQEISQLNAGFKEQIEDIVEKDLTGVTQENAVKAFDAIVYVFSQGFNNGFKGVKGTLSVTLTLKTTKGAAVRKATVKITEDDCTVVK